MYEQIAQIRILLANATMQARKRTAKERTREIGSGE